MDDATFYERLVRLGDGDLSDEERDELLAEIAADSDKQRAFLDHYMLGAALEEHLAVKAAQDPLYPVQSRTVPCTVPHRTGYSLLSEWKTIVPWVISFALMLFIVCGQLIPETPPTLIKEPEPFIGLLIDGAGVEFAEGFGPEDVRFETGEYRLESGVIHLRLDNGADIVVRSPATFRLHDSFHMELLKGDLRAVVPPSAEGFTVAAPKVDYEDLGTEFALSVDRTTGTSELHVFDGQVDAKEPQSKTIISSITEGQSIQFTGGNPEKIDAPDLNRYPTAEAIGFLRWQQQSAGFGKSDPDLIGYYPFTEAEELRNEAANPVTGNGQIKGARWVTGRWPGKAALLFDRDTDFVELNILGEYGELTFAAWLKIDRYEFSHSAIFNSNGWQRSDVHWQIHRTGSMRIGCHGATGGQRPIFKKSVPTNRWIHVAGTISQKNKKASVYVNGELAGWQPVTASNRSRPGIGRIGGWLMETGTDRVPIRSLRGKIDEFAIWKRALTREEILDLVDRGKPSALWSIEDRK